MSKHSKTSESESSSESDSESPNIGVLKGDIGLFKNEVSTYSTIDKTIKDLELKIKPLKEQICELKKQKVELKVNICGYMQTNEIEKCNLPPHIGGTIIYLQKKIVKPITKDIIQNDIKQFFCAGPGKDDKFLKLGDLQKATELIDYIYCVREYKYTDTLSLK